MSISVPNEVSVNKKEDLSSPATHGNVLRGSSGNDKGTLRTSAKRLVASLAVSLSAVRSVGGDQVVQEIINILSDEDFDICLFRSSISSPNDCSSMRDEISMSALERYGFNSV